MIKLAKLKTIYKIYATEFEGPPTLMAIVDGKGVTGKFAENVKQNLIECGWPKIPPNEIYNNGFTFTHIEKVPTGL